MDRQIISIILKNQYTRTLSVIRIFGDQPNLFHPNYIFDKNVIIRQFIVAVS